MAFDATDPAAILGKVNRMLRFQEATVATAVVAFISADLATMRYASAGHPPPIIASSTLPVQSLPYGGAPLGVAPTLELQNHTVQLDRGAVVLFYTDGITEFKRDIAAAETALHNAVAKLVSDPASAHPAVDLQRAVMGSEQPTDDAVLMVVQLAPAKTATTPSETELSKKWTFHSSDPYYAHTSRHELMEFIRRFVVSDDELFRIELIFGEILANTVEHAPGLVRIEIDWRGSRPVVTILDDGPGLMQFSPKLPESELGEGGRGLFLIGTLAGDVQVEATQNTGTKMTVVLPVSRDGA